MSHSFRSHYRVRGINIAPSILIALLFFTGLKLHPAVKCKGADYNVTYSLFPADLTQRPAYLIRVETGSNRTRIYALTQRGHGRRLQTFVTVDGGRHWQRTRPTLANINIVSADAVNTLAVGNTAVAYRFDKGYELWKTNDYGVHWARIDYRINNLSCTEFAISVLKSDHARCRFRLAGATDPDTLFATISVVVGRPPDYVKIDVVMLDELYVSRDGGQQWTLFHKHITTDSPLGINPLNPRVLLAESTEGPVSTIDGGQNWTPVGEQRALQAVAQVQGYPVSPEQIPASGRSPEEQRLLIAGYRDSLQWRKLRVYQFLFDPEDAKTVYFASNKGIYKSSDAGMHWERLIVGGEYANYIDETNAVVALSKKIILVGTSTGIYRSEDGGCHFTVSLQ
jgi:photosystem II stability/assembly factor-like uncharacterized protein